jgi:hypothetical protein
MEREPTAWGNNRADLSLGNINTQTWSSRFGAGHKAEGLALFKKKIIAAKSKYWKLDAV